MFFRMLSPLFGRIAVSLNPNVPFGPYVYTIVKNRILNLLAGLDRELELRDKIRSASLDSTNETEDSVLDTDLNALLDKALETLTPQQKRVFDMSRKDMKSHKEIADSLGISVYTVQQHISTALKVIRAFLAQICGDLYDATALNTHLPLFIFPIGTEPG